MVAGGGYRRGLGFEAEYLLSRLVRVFDAPLLFARRLS